MSTTTPTTPSTPTDSSDRNQMSSGSPRHPALTLLLGRIFSWRTARFLGMVLLLEVVAGVLLGLLAAVTQATWLLVAAPAIAGGVAGGLAALWPRRSLARWASEAPSAPENAPRAR